MSTARKSTDSWQVEAEKIAASYYPTGGGTEAAILRSTLRSDILSLVARVEQETREEMRQALETFIRYSKHHEHGGDEMTQRFVRAQTRALEQFREYADPNCDAYLKTLVEWCAARQAEDSPAAPPAGQEER